MKIKTIILMLAITIYSQAFAFSDALKALQANGYEPLVQSYQFSRERLIQMLSLKTDVWIIAPIADDPKDPMIEMMKMAAPRQPPPFEILTFSEYRDLVLANGFSIVYSEVRRGLLDFDDVQKFRKWLESAWAPQLGFDPNESVQFADQFLLHFHFPKIHIYFPYKELVLHIEKR